MLDKDQIKIIQAPFPLEALSSDVSRGFELTSIKAAYVIERLNEAFGTCGLGWRYVHSPFEAIRTDNGRVEIVTEVAFQYRTQVTDEHTCCGKVVWNTQQNEWKIYGDGPERDWSEPILAAGGKSVAKGGAAYTDARKSAVTDGLTKAASMLGVGHEVFKGLVRVGRDNGRTVPKPDNGQCNSTAFWSLFNTKGKAAGVAEDVAKGLASKGDWEAAVADLNSLIDGAGN